MREIFKTKKYKSILLFQVIEKAVFMRVSNIIRKTLKSQKRIEKEIPLLKFRDIHPKRIVAVVKHNLDLLLASKENVQIFMLAIDTRSNAKNVANRKNIIHT